jgi:hypothetical protein
MGPTEQRDGGQEEIAAEKFAYRELRRLGVRSLEGPQMSARSKIDRHAPIGWFNFAASYHAAADLIVDQGLKATHPESPAMALYLHAIELYLKSFLRLHGGTATSSRHRRSLRAPTR